MSAPVAAGCGEMPGMDALHHYQTQALFRRKVRIKSKSQDDQKRHLFSIAMPGTMSHKPTATIHGAFP
jgi:hypothetical protein